jgi:hypothetical protein
MVEGRSRAGRHGYWNVWEAMGRMIELPDEVPFQSSLPPSLPPSLPVPRASPHGGNFPTVPFPPPPGSFLPLPALSLFLVLCQSPAETVVGTAPEG